MPLPKAEMWMVHSYVRWFGRCDKCSRRRLWSLYYEVHGKCSGCKRCREKGREPGCSIWWWECPDCLVNTLTEKLRPQGGEA